MVKYGMTEMSYLKVSQGQSKPNKQLPQAENMVNPHVYEAAWTENATSYQHADNMQREMTKLPLF